MRYGIDYKANGQTTHSEQFDTEQERDQRLAEFLAPDSDIFPDATHANPYTETPKRLHIIPVQQHGVRNKRAEKVVFQAVWI